MLDYLRLAVAVDVETDLGRRLSFLACNCPPIKTSDRVKWDSPIGNVFS